MTFLIRKSVAYRSFFYVYNIFKIHIFAYVNELLFSIKNTHKQTKNENNCLSINHTIANVSIFVLIEK